MERVTDHTACRQMHTETRSSTSSDQDARITHTDTDRLCNFIEQLGLESLFSATPHSKGSLEDKRFIFFKLQRVTGELLLLQVAT